MPSPPELVAQFTAVTDRLMAVAPDASRRKMFGYPALFAGGHLVTSLHEDRWIVRLPEQQIAELRSLGGTPFEPMAGRPMRGFMVLPEEIRSDAARLDEWLARALAHARTMPPK